MPASRNYIAPRKGFYAPSVRSLLREHWYMQYTGAVIFLALINEAKEQSTTSPAVIIAGLAAGVLFANATRTMETCYDQRNIELHNKVAPFKERLLTNSSILIEGVLWQGIPVAFAIGLDAIHLSSNFELFAFAFVKWVTHLNGLGCCCSRGKKREVGLFYSENGFGHIYEYRYTSQHEKDEQLYHAREAILAMVMMVGASLMVGYKNNNEFFLIGLSIVGTLYLLKTLPAAAQIWLQVTASLCFPKTHKWQPLFVPQNGDLVLPNPVPPGGMTGELASPVGEENGDRELVILNREPQPETISGDPIVRQMLNFIGQRIPRENRVPAGLTNPINPQEQNGDNISTTNPMSLV